MPFVTVTHVSEQLLPISTVYTEGEGQGEGDRINAALPYSSVAPSPPALPTAFFKRPVLVRRPFSYCSLTRSVLGNIRSLNSAWFYSGPKC